MTKRKIQRCIKRVSCRVGALLSTCLILATMVVPAFASNNASTQKWYVADEAQLVSESGSEVRYLKLTPYVGGAEYTYTALCRTANFPFTYPVTSSPSPYTSTVRFVNLINFPDWWRSNLPIGAFSYVDFTLVSLTFNAGTDINGTYGNAGNGTVYFFDSSNAFTSSFDLVPPSNVNFDSSNPNYPSIRSSTYYSNYPFFPLSAPASGNYQMQATGYAATIGKTYRFNISNSVNLVFAPYLFNSSGGYPLFAQTNLYNLSSDNFCIAICGSQNDWYYKSQFKLSFWVDANKLPAGLQVGDEFPANNDAFDDLRDELLKQFPEASDHIENGKDTINGWNDTETVGQDVAESSLSVINGLFQNLGQFLAVVSLMIFGAVCLRMLVKKAVS